MHFTDSRREECSNEEQEPWSEDWRFQQRAVRNGNCSLPSLEQTTGFGLIIAIDEGQRTIEC